VGLKKRGVEGDGEEAAPDVVVVGVVVDGGEGVQDQGSTGCFSFHIGQRLPPHRICQNHSVGPQCRSYNWGPSPDVGHSLAAA